MRKLALCATTFCTVMMTSAIAAEFTATDLAKEEGKFAAYSVKHGMRAAFLEFFAAQSWLLRPEPVDAQAWIRGRPDPPIVLDWRSQRTILSASGEMGFSTGPSIYRSKADPKAPASHGEFFSVWQKQQNGEWKVFIDHGISHGPTTTPDALPATPLIALNLVALKAGLPAYDAEKDFTDRSSKMGSKVAYDHSVTNQSVLLRNGMLPITGKANVADYVNSKDGNWNWAPKMQGTSRAGDLAYVVGNYEGTTRNGETTKGQYVRVWVRDASADTQVRWTIAGDVMTPQPPPKQ
ncbi:MAG: hypothetical protein ABI583_02920 [Betaproteobacteria bacterium]